MFMKTLQIIAIAGFINVLPFLMTDSFAQAGGIMPLGEPAEVSDTTVVKSDSTMMKVSGAAQKRTAPAAAKTNAARVAQPAATPPAKVGEESQDNKVASGKAPAKPAAPAQPATVEESKSAPKKDE